MSLNYLSLGNWTFFLEGTQQFQNLIVGCNGGSHILRKAGTKSRGKHFCRPWTHCLLMTSVWSALLALGALQRSHPVALVPVRKEREVTPCLCEGLETLLNRTFFLLGKMPPHRSFQQADMWPADQSLRTRMSYGLLSSEVESWPLCLPSLSLWYSFLITRHVTHIYRVAIEFNTLNRQCLVIKVSGSRETVCRNKVILSSNAGRSWNVRKLLLKKILFS